MLQAIDLTKRYEDGVLALDHLNLTVSGGELFALLGANGAGKTTTINLILGFIDPTEGTAVIDGGDVVENPLESKERVSFLPENVTLYGNLTGLQNLHFFARLAGKRCTGEEYAMALRDAGKAVFISTHDIFRAREIADRVGSREELKSEGVRRRSLSFQDRSGEILRSKKVFCRHFRLLQNGRYGALRQIPRVIGNSRSMSSNRVPPNLVAASCVSVKRKSQPPQFLDHLSIGES